MTVAGNPLVGRPHLAPIGEPPPRVAVPVRGTSVLTGRERDCRAELVGFASPIGRLSAVLRITDPATGRTGTSVVPVELPAPIERDTGIAEIAIAPGDIRLRELRAETEAVCLVVRLAAAARLDGLIERDLDDIPAHEQAIALTTALSGGALAGA